MLFTADEFNRHLSPLLVNVPDDADQAVAEVAFSCLVEPGDGFAGAVSEHMPLPRLLEALINRSDAGQMIALLGEEAVTEIERTFESTWGRLWGNAQQRWLPRLMKSEVISALDWMNQQGSGLPTRHRLVLKSDSGYPQKMTDLNHHAPFALWCLGDAELLSAQHSISIVGTRTVSSYGAGVTADLATVAAQNGIVTVSGGAFGVDAVVHQSAVALESGTVAVMAGGLGNLYPRGNHQILAGVAQVGAIVSECPPWVTPAKFRFLQRNRLIAALTDATVVVEAGATSGALSTATHAVSLGRQVAVVPGIMDSARSVGCHDFVNRYLGMVRLVARPSEIVELAGIATDATESLDTLGRLEKRALDAFSSHPIEAWEVQRLAGLTVRETQIALGSLELLELVERVGSAYRRVIR